MQGKSIKGVTVVQRRFCRSCGQLLRPWQRLACSEECYQPLWSGRATKALWSRVDKNGPVPVHCPELGPCWLWIGSCIPAGYGHVTVDCQSYYTHRLAYELEYGPIPDEGWIMHRCDNPPCCRPSHLKVGTQLENIQDCIAKGRKNPPHMTGATNPNSKLSADDVLAIRYLVANGAKQVDIAHRFRVGRDQIGLIVSHQSWRHLA